MSSLIFGNTALPSAITEATLNLPNKSVSMKIDDADVQFNTIGEDGAPALSDQIRYHVIISPNLVICTQVVNKLFIPQGFNWLQSSRPVCGINSSKQSQH